MGVVLTLYVSYMQLRVVSPTGELYHGEVEQVSIPTESGYIAVLPGHMNIVTSLVIGDISYLPVMQEAKTTLETFIDRKALLSVVSWLAMIEDDIVTITLEA